MSLLNENISLKIKDVQYMSWNVSTVTVAPRPQHALVFRLCGSALFLHGNIQQKTNSGDVFYMPANYSYKADYTEKNEIIVIHFDSDLISHMENFSLTNSHVVSVMFQKIYDIWTKKEDGYYYAALSQMCKILQNISSQQTPSFGSETLTAFENAVEYMENNYTSSEFSVQQMVAKAFISNTYFRKMFCARFGMTPVKYLMSKRLIYAEKLLSTGKYSIKEAAEKSGFCDAKYFSRVVKEAYGVSPSKLYNHIKTN